MRVRSFPWMNLGFLSVTVVTTLLAGALNAGVNPFTHPFALAAGIPFSASLLGILGAHELGHYFMGRRYGIRITLPFFIPAPPIPPLAIGTFGALIRMKSPVGDRRSLFDVGIAGPLAGLVVALPVIVIGLHLSRRVPVGPGSESGILLGSPLLFLALQWLTLGPGSPGHDVLLHPVAFAGWFGLFVTGLNLLPIGQLDGGHIAYALLGRRHRIISLLTLGALVVMGVTAWPGWLVWATLAFVLGRRHPPPLDDEIRLDRKRRILGVLVFLLLLSLIIPTPFTLPDM